MEQYGVLADGAEPVLGMGVSIQDDAGTAVALGRIAYLDKSDPEIRVELLEEYVAVALERGWKFAVAAKHNVWILGRSLRKLDDGTIQQKESESIARVRQLSAQDTSPEFLGKLEAGTSEFEPTWPGGSWSASKVEDCYGLSPGMRFRFMGTPEAGSVLLHGKVFEIKFVHVGDPFYVWPNSDGPIAVVIAFHEGVKTWIARPTGKLQARFGSSVREFMAEWQYVPERQKVVTIHARAVGDESAELVGVSVSGDSLAGLSATLSWSVAELEAKLLALEAMSPSDEEKLVLVLPDGRMVKDLPRDLTVRQMLAA